MHIPDGFLDTPTAIAGGVLAAAGLGLALRTVRRTLPHRAVPLVGVAAAFIFAAQMLNFPVAGGTSGHLIGAVLAAVLLGPSAAVLVMSSVLILQAFLFADGGITALGANIFNMALVASLLGYALYRGVSRLLGGGLRARLAGVAFGAWCSTVAAAVTCAGQLALSGTVAWEVAFPAMAGVHMLIGVGEALITTLVVAVIATARPELLFDRAGPGEWIGRTLAGYGLLVTLGLVIFVAPLASEWPDGLEAVAGRLGFAHKAAASPAASSPLADYALAGVGSPAASTAIAGGIGTVVAFGLAYLLAIVLVPRGTAGSGRPPGSSHDSAPRSG
ncbi:MAG: energy-coupling factor ABC transporter permease [Armatimonadota bacterium]|nr:energy-coupling factor ABC transporter permease [Armatimonadota bacterium]MDR7427714.1 energy-coupling factor ABC transporter permease [Armatimonadota bacterium]MDR7469625.1 energy-coupling factor ABC transporter permease [Armatimonadota bacterium]MDR7474944.1 energy-coupling factor ABC transporter permease [Armatimonadota bacterium]MDR7538344.1 energy-coupling factor ABC transporter permease [Armatimonadota bacterium]